MKHSMRTLIVDDNEVCRTRDEKILSKHFECEIAENGFEAFKKICRNLKNNSNFDLILLDINMPIMDGLTALEAIREAEALKDIPLGKGAKIIMTTAVDESKSIMNSFNKGCEAYLVKPYTNKQLIEKIDELLGVMVQ